MKDKEERLRAPVTRYTYRALTQARMQIEEAETFVAFLKNDELIKRLDAARRELLMAENALSNARSHSADLTPRRPRRGKRARRK